MNGSLGMANNVGELLKRIKNNPNGIRFAELIKICDFYFGESRQSGSSHKIYKTPWPGDPRVNIQQWKSESLSG
jgi:hypothetical protein